MIEILIVLFVVAVAVYGVTTLVFSNLALQQRDADNIKAMNMAREMMEFAQNKRDSNWLGDQAFYSGMSDLVGGCTIVPMYDGTGDLSFRYVTDIDQPAAKVKRSSNPTVLSMFTNVSGTSTEFNRMLTMIPICANADHSVITYPIGQCLCATAPQDQMIGVRAKAEVKWARNGKTRNLSVYTDLYDWK